jgi:nicotinamidase-related amidase
MKTIILTATFAFSSIIMLHAQKSNTALLLIDIQDFYFPGGKMELVNPEPAARKAAVILNEFRKEGLIIVHVRHNSEPGGEINNIVKPLQGEKVISKNEVNSFLGTDLLDYLKSRNVKTLIICGMQTHMCVEAATRAGSDLGFKCILIHDACATRDLKFNEKIIKAEDVHYSTLSTLKNYASVVSADEFLANFK